MNPQPDSLDKRTVLKEALRAVNDMQAQLQAAERVRTEPIAIIGMGCRFPGGAGNPDAYWRLLERGGDAIVEVPASRWTRDDYAALDPETARQQTLYGGFLDNVDRFDPHFFGIAPREAAALDPQHRMVLEVCWESLEHACVSPDQLRGSLTGVFVGITSNDYASHLLDVDPGRVDIYSASGNVHNSAAGRVSYLLGLHGPSMAIDTACSSSLTAIHLACQSLRLGESDVALAGGVNSILTPEGFVGFSKAGMLAHNGRCKAFDAGADGLVRAEGCGMVVLKRLSDAVAAGDRVLALIRGSAVNQDGPSSGLTVPNGPAQQAVIRKALSTARIKPADVQYVEAHGTGTSLGDPIELEALDAVLADGRPAGQRLIVGAVKTNVGHLEAASGVAGLMKIVLSLEHETIPPNLHFTRLNPAVTLRNLEVHVPTAPVPWRRGDRPRIAGVSSFGLSGTNAHLVVEEPPLPSPAEPSARGAELVVVSAKTRTALTTLAGQWHDSVAGRPGVRLEEIARSSTVGRAHFAHRAAAVATTTSELATQLQAIAAAGPGARLGDCSSGERPAVAFLFTGQGSQYAGMGQQLYKTQPVFRAALDECDALLRGELDAPLLSLMFDTANDRINQTAITQPALFALEYALYRLWRSWGIEPVAVLGHSVGEYVAAYAAGVFSLGDGLRLIAARGRLMQQLPAGGAMAAVFADEARVRRAIAAEALPVDVAAANGPANVVVAGPAGPVKTLCSALEREGVSSQALVVSHAFHSALMDPMLDEFRRVASSIAFQAPRLAFVSNVTGELVGAGSRLDADYWVRHVRGTVRFAEGMRALGGAGCSTFLELGPTPTLITMAQRFIGDADVEWLHSLRRGRNDWQELLTSLGRLYVKGADINWREAQQGAPAAGIALPTYPYERERHWVDRPAGSVKATPAATNDVDVHPLLGRHVKAAVRATIYEKRVSRSSPAFLAEHVVTGEAVFPATGYIEMAAAAARRHANGAAWRVVDVAVATPLLLSDEQVVVQTIVTADADGGAAVEILSARGTATEWTTHATARIEVADSFAAIAATPLGTLQDRIRTRSSVEAFYDAHRARGIEYGPSFRAIGELFSGDGESLGRIVPAASDAGFIVHPATLDACVQLLGAAAPKADASSEMYLPVGVGEVRHVRDGDVAWSHVTIAVGDDPVSDGFTANVTLMDATGETLSVLQGVRLRHANAEALRRAVHRATDEWLYGVRWTELETPATSDGALSPGTWVLVEPESSESGRALSSTLETLGQHVRVVRTDADLAALGREAAAIAPPLGGFIQIPAGEGAAGAAVAKATQPLLTLAQTVLESGLSTTAIWVVTSGAQQVHDEPVNPAHAPVWALARTISIEHPQIACRCVDVEKWDATTLQLIARLIAAGGAEPSLAVRDNRLLAARLVRTELRGAADAADSVALEIPRRGVLDHLELRRTPRRPPGPGEVEVRVSYAGLNFRDVLNALGMYPGEAGPLGAECVGTVTAAGAGVTHVSVGDEVMGMVGGSLRSYVTTAAALVAPRPRSTSAEAAASLPIAFLTAEYALNHLAGMQRHDRVLIHAGAGGVGLAAIQVAQRAGAEVFATAGSPEKRAFLAALGVQHVLDSRTLAFADEIRERTGGRGVDIVLNSLAGDFITKSVSALAENGRFVEIGKKDIWTPEQMAAVRPDVRYFPLYLGDVDPRIIQAMLQQLAHDVDAGALKPLPSRVYPLAEAAAGFRFMAQARHIGKIVFRCHTAVQPAAVRADASYLITGGFGALGLVSAQWLASRGARHLVLVGRRAPSSDAAAAIAQLESTGVTVRVVSADLAIADEVGRVFAAVDDGPALRGIVHCAGVVADGTIERLTWDGFASVFGPKVDGTWELHQHTRNRELDFFVLFSSMSSVIPAPGQGNYAAANAYLDAVARQRHALGLPAVSVNWGPWAEGGMASHVDAQSHAKWERLGLGTISRAQGAAILDRVAAAPSAQVAVLPIDWQHFAGAFPGGTPPPLIADLVKTSGRSAARTEPRPTAPALVARLEGAPSKSRARIVETYVRDVVRQVLGVATSHTLELSQGLRAMGMDSLMAVELRNHLQAGVGRPLPSTIAFEHSTVGALAKYLGGLLDVAPGANDSTVAESDDDGAATLLELSDEDAEALLAQELEK